MDRTCHCYLARSRLDMDWNGLGHGCREPFTKRLEEMKIGLGSIMGGFTNDDMDRTYQCHLARS
jgi:hypothetical protein